MSNYTKIENIDEFNNMVDTFLETHNELKEKVKEQRGNIIETERVGEEPLTKAEKQFEPLTKKFTNALTLFQNFANMKKGLTEIKLSLESNKGKLGEHGVIDLKELEDNQVKLTNKKTGATYDKKINDNVAELLIKPLKSIDTTSLKTSDWEQYYDIMNFAGMSSKANNNKKWKQAKAQKQGVGVPVLLTPPVTPESTALSRVQSTRRERAKSEPTSPSSPSTPSAFIYEEFKPSPSPPPASQRKVAKGKGKGSTQTGQGIIYSTPDEIVERLMLLTKSMQAGNVSDALRNEVMDICDKLLADKIIGKQEYRKLYKKYINY